MLPAIRGDLLQFAGTDVDARRRLRQPLGETFHRTDVGRLGQKLQFIEKLLGLARVLVVADDGDQHGAFATIGRGDRLGIQFIFFQNNSILFPVSTPASAGSDNVLQTRCYK